MRDRLQLDGDTRREVDSKTESRTSVQIVGRGAIGRDFVEKKVRGGNEMRN